MSSNLRRAILVFSKAADHGAVKTRLRPILDDVQCLSLHLAFLQDTLQKAQSVAFTDVYLFLAGSGNLPFQTSGISIRMQDGENLGERMRRAFAEMLHQYGKVVIIGTDCPALDTRILSLAFTMLDSNDLVIGPSEDGGYYLIGLSHPAFNIFQDITWGTAEVLQQTIKAAAQYAYALLDPLFDIDVPDDLIRLQKQVSLISEKENGNTIAWLRNWKRHKA